MFGVLLFAIIATSVPASGYPIGPNFLHHQGAHSQGPHYHGSGVPGGQQAPRMSLNYPPPPGFYPPQPAEEHHARLRRAALDNTIAFQAQQPPRFVPNPTWPQGPQPAGGFIRRPAVIEMRQTGGPFLQAASRVRQINTVQVPIQSQGARFQAPQPSDPRRPIGGVSSPLPLGAFIPPQQLNNFHLRDPRLGRNVGNLPFVAGNYDPSVKKPIPTPSPAYGTPTTTATTSSTTTKSPVAKSSWF